MKNGGKESVVKEKRGGENANKRMRKQDERMRERMNSWIINGLS